MTLPTLFTDDAAAYGSPGDGSGNPWEGPTEVRDSLGRSSAGGNPDHRATERRILEIENRLRRSALLCLTFFLNEAGSRIQVTLSRPTSSSSHIARLVVREAPFNGLTIREHDVASSVALGFSNDDIAELLGIAKRTVDKHVGNVLARLGLQNRAQIATLIAATCAWLVPLPAGSSLEDQIQVLGILGDVPMRPGTDTVPVEVGRSTLHVGSLLPADPQKQLEAVPMSQGEDLALTGTAADISLCSRFPVTITRVFAADTGVEQAVTDLRRAGIQALTIGNFNIADAERILNHPDLRGIPILHSMVNQQVHSYTDPAPAYAHVFQMCADESVYLRALGAYIRRYRPTTKRISVVIRDSDNIDAVAAVRAALASDPAVDLQVIRFDDRDANLARIALELLHFNPDVAYLGIYVESALVEILANLETLGLHVQLFGVWVPGLPGFTQRHPDLAEGLVWSTLVGNSNNHFGTQFRSSFEAKYRSSPGIGSAAVHYDMIGLLRRAWQDTGLDPDPASIISALNAVRFTGVTGSFHFDGGRQRKALCFPFDTDDPAIGQPCLTFKIQHGKSIPISLHAAD